MPTLFLSVSGRSHPLGVHPLQISGHLLSGTSRTALLSVALAGCASSLAIATLALAGASALSCSLVGGLGLVLLARLSLRHERARAIMAARLLSAAMQSEQPLIAHVQRGILPAGERHGGLVGLARKHALAAQLLPRPSHRVLFCGLKSGLATAGLGVGLLMGPMSLALVILSLSLAELAIEWRARKSLARVAHGLRSPSSPRIGLLELVGSLQQVLRPCLSVEALARGLRHHLTLKEAEARQVAQQLIAMASTGAHAAGNNPSLQNWMVTSAIDPFWRELLTQAVHRPSSQRLASLGRLLSLALPVENRNEECLRPEEARQLRQVLALLEHDDGAGQNEGAEQTLELAATEANSAERSSLVEQGRPLEQRTGSIAGTQMVGGSASLEYLESALAESRRRAELLQQELEAAALRFEAIETMHWMETSSLREKMRDREALQQRAHRLDQKIQELEQSLQAQNGAMRGLLREVERQKVLAQRRKGRLEQVQAEFAISRTHASALRAERDRSLAKQEELEDALQLLAEQLRSAQAGSLDLQTRLARLLVQEQERAETGALLAISARASRWRPLLEQLHARGQIQEAASLAWLLIQTRLSAELPPPEAHPLRPSLPALVQGADAYRISRALLRGTGRESHRHEEITSQQVTAACDVFLEALLEFWPEGEGTEQRQALQQWLCVRAADGLIGHPHVAKDLCEAAFWLSQAQQTLLQQRQFIQELSDGPAEPMQEAREQAQSCATLLKYQIQAGLHQLAQATEHCYGAWASMMPMVCAVLSGAGTCPRDWILATLAERRRIAAMEEVERWLTGPAYLRWTIEGQALLEENPGMNARTLWESQTVHILNEITHRLLRLRPEISLPGAPDQPPDHFIRALWTEETLHSLAQRVKSAILNHAEHSSPQQIELLLTRELNHPAMESVRLLIQAELRRSVLERLPPASSWHAWLWGLARRHWERFAPDQLPSDQMDQLRAALAEHQTMLDTTGAEHPARPSARQRYAVLQQSLHRWETRWNALHSARLEATAPEINVALAWTEALQAEMVEEGLTPAFMSPAAIWECLEGNLDEAAHQWLQQTCTLTREQIAYEQIAQVFPNDLMTEEAVRAYLVMEGLFQENAPF
jgi:hypothetical protein